ncbi:MAG: triple tyrosine motif-containing protein [Bacteroidales bacterium]|jgi:ligand-binding sensor domain-containing protein/DNA-binding CsgD family transcriptional regulator|nr:triple tyrosine motif-containing protein [Bacteroidales bacterium]
MTVPSFTATVLNKTRNVIIILVIFPTLSLTGQFKSIGVPEIWNIDRNVYSGGTQNWNIAGDEQGNIYVANNNGILRFDGEDWETFPASNNSVIRSLAFGADNKLYVGAYNEIGVLERSASEGIRYSSLNHLIPEDASNFDDVWNIYQTRFGVVFQSFEIILIYKNDTVHAIRPADRFGNSFYVNNNYYVVEIGVGLRMLVDDGLQTITDDRLFSQDEIQLLTTVNANDLLVGTMNNGLFVLSGQTMQPWDTEISEELKKSKLYCGSVHNSTFLFGTIKSGLFVVNERGEIQEHLSRSNGLQNNTVLSLFVDRQDNVWLGLDIGIDFLKSSLPTSVINDNFNIAATYATAIHNGRFYIGTNQGLYTKELGKLRSHINIEYDLVDGMEGQVWNLTVAGGQLLCGHHNGAYSIDGTKSTKLTNSRGVWNFKPIPGHDKLMLSGTYDGLIIFEKGRDGRWKFRNRVQGFDVSSKDLILRDDNCLWMSHGYLGLFHIHLNEALDSVILVKEYRGIGNLPEELPYILHVRSGDFFISTSQGIYQYDEQKELFNKPEELNDFFKDFTLIYFLKEDHNRNLWYSAREGMGVFRLLEDGTFTNISTPFLDLNYTRVSPFDNIYIQDPANIFIGTQKGLVHYDPSVYKNYFDEMYVYINRVAVSSKREDSLYYFSGNSHLAEREINEQFSLPYAWNNISFRFNSPDMENAGHIEYSYRLMNFDDDWSNWTALNSKEYTNLHEGDYCFEVKARNIYGNVSSEDRFCFTVEPPFSRSYKALILYFLLFSGIIMASAYFYKRRIDRVRLQEKDRQINAFKKTEQTLEEQKLAAEAEVMQLKNERLQSEMNHKNKELTSAAYHIIQKNKFLNSLKQELSSLIQNAKNESVVADLKKISRKIDRDIQNEKSWEVFDRYFDEVHQEFHSRLRNLHPELTPGELRLCSYLRMNVSTKEIAPLMNISIRGVEISRYRLRKKLKLDQSANLVDYLMQI